MKEDYISFEIAKLLKEKGFDVCTKSFYKKIDQLLHHNTCALAYFGNSTTLPAPTLQMAMKWLREKHNIHIEIHYLSESDDYSYVINNVSNGGIMCVGGFDKYENAVETAIIECLTNLI